MYPREPASAQASAGSLRPYARGIQEEVILDEIDNKSNDTLPGFDEIENDDNLLPGFEDIEETENERLPGFEDVEETESDALPEANLTDTVQNDFPSTPQSPSFEE